MGTRQFQILGTCPAWTSTVQAVQRIARAGLTCVLEGETGTGKEVLATVYASAADRALVCLDCSALGVLADDALFGHARGAYTDADGARVGAIKRADGGVLHLDEIGELPLHLQSKLLRVLQEGQVKQLGSDVVHRIDIMTVASTHRDLAAEVQAGRFRQDLYYRLCEVPVVRVPPLRERTADLGTFAVHFLAESFPRLQLSEATAALLGAFPWDAGNLRELRQAVLSAALVATTAGSPTVDPHHFRSRCRDRTLVAPVPVLASYLGLSTRAVYRRIRSGDIVQTVPGMYRLIGP